MAARGGHLQRLDGLRMPDDVAQITLLRRRLLRRRPDERIDRHGLQLGAMMDEHVAQARRPDDADSADQTRFDGVAARRDDRSRSGTAGSKDGRQHPCDGS